MKNILTVIKEIPSVAWGFLVIYAFNLSVQFGFTEEADLEKIMFKILSKKFALIEALNILEKNVKDKAELNTTMTLCCGLVVLDSKKLSDELIWNEALSEKISTKILKEYFRKVNFELSCRGLAPIAVV